MKLPEKLKREACHLGMATHSELYEAIVRDCARIAGDMAKRENDGYDRNGHERAILARYGLKPEDSHEQ